MDRIVVAFASEEAQRRIVRLLESEGHVPAGSFFSGADVIRTVHQLGSAAVVCGFKLRDMWPFPRFWPFRPFSSIWSAPKSAPPSP